MNATEKMQSELQTLNRRIEELKADTEAQARRIGNLGQNHADQLLYYITTFLPSDIKRLQDEVTKLRHTIDKKEMLEYFLRDEQ